MLEDVATLQADLKQEKSMVPGAGRLISSRAAERQDRQSLVYSLQDTDEQGSSGGIYSE